MLLDSHPRLNWAGLIISPSCGLLGLVAINCVDYFVFLAEDFTTNTPPHVGPSSWEAHSIRIY